MSKWIDQIFKADIVKKSGIVRRKKASVQRFASEAELLQEVKKRGFHLVETGDQYVVLCHKGNFKLHC